jgi:hypothetical protein
MRIDNTNQLKLRACEPCNFMEPSLVVCVGDVMPCQYNFHSMERCWFLVQCQGLGSLSQNRLESQQNADKNVFHRVGTLCGDATAIMKCMFWGVTCWDLQCFILFEILPMVFSRAWRVVFAQSTSIEQGS